MNKFIEVNELQKPMIINVEHIIKYHSLKGRDDYSTITFINGTQITVTDSLDAITNKIEGCNPPQTNKYLTIDNKQLRIKNKRLSIELKQLKA